MSDRQSRQMVPMRRVTEWFGEEAFTIRKVAEKHLRPAYVEIGDLNYAREYRGAMVPIWERWEQATINMAVHVGEAEWPYDMVGVLEFKRDPAEQHTTKGNDADLARYVIQAEQRNDYLNTKVEMLEIQAEAASKKVLVLTEQLEKAKQENTDEQA